jgi:glutaconate CoA-transferase subunit A
MSDKTTSIEEIVAEVRPGMTIGIGGWGSRRKPMAFVRALCRSGVGDLDVVAYGGPDVGLLSAAGKVRRVIASFVTLDSIALDPHWRTARQQGRVELTELDEGMFYLGLQAAAWRVPFLPSRAGLGADLMTMYPDLRTVRSPYTEGPFTDPADAGIELVAVPALRLDLAVVHANRADRAGNAQFLGPDPYFDDLFLGAARRRFVTAERIVGQGELEREGPLATVGVHRLLTDGVCATPHGAHFTACPPDYGRDERFQREYAAAAGDPDAWATFRERYLDVDEAAYQAAVTSRAAR